ncbi:MAG TPA: hypothetical protein VGM90_06470 [Kofleriaceae bacterium]|jgi:hypothetical protein
MTRIGLAVFTAALLTHSFGCTGGSPSEPGTAQGGDDTSSGGGGGGGGGGGSGATDPTAPDPDDTDTQPTYSAQHPRIYLGPNKDRLQQALSASSPAATRFKTVVDQWVGGADLWGFDAWNAALLGQLTNQPQYCAKAVATVETQVVSAEAKIALNLAPEVAADSYLEVGPDIGNLALVFDWCYGNLSSSQKTRWITYANQAINNVWNHTTAKWGNATLPWSGWATDDPSDNYYYSFLRGTMLLGLATKGENDRADEWIAKFHDDKVMGELVPIFQTDLVGGGSREGTGYGVAMRGLFELYAWWHDSTGESLATKTTHARFSLASMINQTLPTLDRVAPTGDHPRDSTASYFDYHRHYLQTLMALFPNDPNAARAKSLLAQSSVPKMTEQFMYVDDFIYDETSMTEQPLDGMSTAYHAAGIGELYVRSGWDKHATWWNLIAGPYTQSHAHQDQGSLMIYKDGWLAYDPNVDSHSGLNQDTTAHGLVRISQGGSNVRQVADTESTVEALEQGTGYIHVAADLTNAYDGNAAVQKVQREIVYLGSDVLVVYDRVATASGTQQTWQLSSPVQAQISGNAASITNAGHTLKVTKVAGGPMSTFSFASSEFTGGFRLDENQSGGDQRYLHVLSIDGAAATVTANGTDGVTVQLAGGKTAVVTFNNNAIGGTLVLDGTTTQLGATVNTLQ